MKGKIVDEGMKLFNWKVENQANSLNATSSQFKSILAIIFLNTFNVYGIHLIFLHSISR